MSVTPGVRIEADCDRPGAVVVTISEGVPFAIPIRINGAKSDGHDVLRQALTDCSWVAQVRSRRGGAGEILAVMDKAETTTGQVLELAFACDDSSGLSDGGSYPFDLLVLDGPAAGSRILVGSRVVVEAAASAAVEESA